LRPPRGTIEPAKPTKGDAPLEHPTVLVADEDIPHRRGVRAGLEAHGFIVVAEAGEAAQAVSAASRLRPNICLIDVEIPGGGLNAIARIAKASPRSQIVVLSSSDRAGDVVGAVTRGASGYLLRGLSNEQLASALRATFAGEPAVSRSLVPHLVDEIRRESTRRLTMQEGAVTLTPREWEVGEMLVAESSTTEIADRLGVSPVTVRRHVGQLLRKLGVETREEAVEVLRTYGWR
jgi:two-component system, NarL family, nitrate/nitrite response regulator NarL